MNDIHALFKQLHACTLHCGPHVVLVMAQTKKLTSVQQGCGVFKTHLGPLFDHGSGIHECVWA